MRRNFMIIVIGIVIITMMAFMTSCEESGPYYPVYSITQNEGIPDSLKVKHSEYILNLINLGYKSGSDNENVEDILYAAKRVADRMFKIKIMGLKKEFNGDSDDDLFIKPENFTETETRIFEFLLNDTDKLLSLSEFKRREKKQIDLKHAL